MAPPSLPQGRLVFVASFKTFFSLLENKKKYQFSVLSFCIYSEVSILQKEGHKLRVSAEERASFTYICILLTHQTCWLERDALIRNTTKLLYVCFPTPLCLALSPALPFLLPSYSPRLVEGCTWPCFDHLLSFCLLFWKNCLGRKKKKSWINLNLKKNQRLHILNPCVLPVSYKRNCSLLLIRCSSDFTFWVWAEYPGSVLVLGANQSQRCDTAEVKPKVVFIQCVRRRETTLKDRQLLLIGSLKRIPSGNCWKIQSNQQ